MKIYGYFRSSAAYRVRTALHLKNIDFENILVNLVSGEQKAKSYKDKNPQGLVPTLEDGDVTIGQSLAIIDYLDEKYPDPLLVYGTAEDKAYIRQLAMIVACEIHPLNNLKVWKGYLGKKLGLSDEQSMEWYHHWIKEGFAAYESLLETSGKAGKFSCGDKVSLADICLIPQLYNARRFNVDLSAFPKILEIEKNCMALEAFQKAAPESQPDAPEGLVPIHGPAFKPV